jgi:putative transposase
MLREAVLVMQVEVRVSQRRACGLIEVHRASCRYRRRRSEDPGLPTRLRELAEIRRRFGYRRLQVLLLREGWRANHKRIYRLYVEEKLGLRRKARTETLGCAPAAAGAYRSQPSVVGGFHDRCSEFGTQVPDAEHRG